MLNPSINNPLSIKLNTRNLALYQVYRAIKGTALVLGLDLTEEDDIETAFVETYKNQASNLLYKLYPNRSHSDILDCFYDDINLISKSLGN